MAYSTIYVGMVGAALAVGCGNGDDDGGTAEENCEVRLLDPCPDCGSGEVLRASEGAQRIVARPNGGYIGTCNSSIQWHDRDFSVSDSARVDLADEAWSIEGIAGGDEIVFAYIARENPSQRELVAVRRGGGELWRVDASSAGPSPLMTTSADSVYLLNRESTQQADDIEWKEWWRIASYVAETGTRRWTWRFPDEDSYEPTYQLDDLRFVPRDGGSDVLQATLWGALDLGAAGIVESEDHPSIVSVEMRAAGVPGPASAEVMTELPPGTTAWWRAPDGRVAVKGNIGAELELPGGVVLNGSEDDETDWFLAQLGPDGLTEWATVLSFPETQSVRGVAFVDDALVVAGTTYRHSVQTNPANAFVMTMRDGAIEWRVDAVGDSPNWTTEIFPTGDETAIVAMVAARDPNANPTYVPMLTFGRIELEGPTSVVVELAP